jgi:PAB1-binding protein PBP1
VLQYNPAYPLTEDGADLVVLASKGGLECRTGIQVSATFEDLQSMQNHMRETVDAGLIELQSHKNGLPAPPPSAMGTVTQASFAMGAPPPDPTAGQLISQQYQEADGVEQATLSDGSGGAAFGGGAVPQAPTTVSLGMSPAQVVGAMGQPKNIMDLGAKKIYVYQDLKITFQDGKVSDVN